MRQIDFNKISNYFQTKPVLKAYVFGSYARNEADEKSDLDILVELDYENGGASLENWLNMFDDLNKLVGIKVDLVSAGGLSKFIAPYIHQDKKLIYAK
ncbi:MAG: hypothetical protein RL065_766 [Bacteroidota bacterium]|jgi:predicted nucleotidyltransferase